MKPMATTAKTKIRLTETDLIEKGHTHIVEGTLRFDHGRNKQFVTINTRGIDGNYDGNTREIATSDLHQTFWTIETKAAIDAAKRKPTRRRQPSKAKTQTLTPDHEVFVLMTDEEYAALCA
jgi:hypothetical protein